MAAAPSEQVAEHPEEPAVDVASAVDLVETPDSQEVASHPDEKTSTRDDESE